MSDDSTAGTTTNTGGEAPAATAPAAAAAPAATAATQQQGTEGQPTAPAAAAPAGEAAPQGAPESYEFKAPENSAFNPTVIAEYSAVAKELGLTQDAAQKILDRVSPAVATAQQAQLQGALDKAVADFEKAAKADKDIGGDKYDENMAIAKTSLETYGDKDLADLLKVTGIGSHPAFLRYAFKVGKTLTPDNKPFAGSNKPASPPRDAATVLYGNQSS